MDNYTFMNQHRLPLKYIPTVAIRADDFNQMTVPINVFPTLFLSSAAASAG